MAIWEMVKEVASEFGREVSYAEIRQAVKDRYGDQNDATLNCAIISSSVNHPSRIHYQENKKPRVCNREHDFLFNTGRGRVEPYNLAKHGTWEIFTKEDGGIGVRMMDGVDTPEKYADAVASDDVSIFALESHLRDYLAKNISKLKTTDAKLSVYVSADGRDGVEFQTDVGPIDILAIDEQSRFVVIELKVGRGPDAALGQILRYMGWVQKHLANENQVRGVIVAAEIPKKLRYAVTQVSNVTLMEYELDFSVNQVEL